MWRFVSLVIILLAINPILHAQKLAKARVDGLYMDPLDKVLDQITRETGVQFIFDRDKLALIRYEARNFGLPLTDFLDQICKQNRLKYFENEKGVVVIFDMFEDPRET